ncbi:Glucokinase [Candidatus Portiera aleyrodidarum]|uniref:Glucokinase n=1 Tax=Candidatus Portiera aleyrodidarum TV TaxID=1297582 RepID=A0A8D3X7L1_9GAMM|nr:glucokinase [Candidatus Portiera aleyrodidarum]AGI27193.1 glucokinase [Candidatus Portiera aleyrodidarum TV]CEI59177.1 Glucokinase [Candidatus Portiera aleyrodidarum]
MNNLSLVGDIGGTNVRLALVSSNQFNLYKIKIFKCINYINIFEVIQKYIDLVDCEYPKYACLAFACPVNYNLIKMTNNSWKITKYELKHKMNLHKLKIINDFTAIALGLPHIQTKDLYQIGYGKNNNTSNKMLIGPGTGLGIAGLIPNKKVWIPLSGEGGHISFAPLDKFETYIFNWFKKLYNRVSIERILCGQGIVDLYNAHVNYYLKNYKTILKTPDAITTAALTQKDPLAYKTIMRFCKILGHVTGDIALTLGAKGGVYLCGGILPRIINILDHSEFRISFYNKGRMSFYNQEISTWLVTSKWIGLLGAADALFNNNLI